METGITFIITTLNSKVNLGICLECLSAQEYPKRLIEVLILDGGSTDGTIELAKKFPQAKVIKAGMSDNQEGRRYLGFKKAKFDLVCVLDSDNYLQDRQWIKKMIQPLIENPDVVSSFTLHYQYDPNQTIFNRYIALFGGNDPVVYYLGKADRTKWTNKKWPRSNQIISYKKGYALVKFSYHDFPTLGSNGSIIRKEFLNLKKLSADTFFHTDILFDLLKQGRDTHAVVDTAVLHATSTTLKKHLQKRQGYMRLHHLQMLSKRRFKIFDYRSIRDWVKLAGFIIISTTGVIPLAESLWGYRKTKDNAWFLHPLVCFSFLLIYGQAILVHAFYGHPDT
ncbi:MAG: glycosyltransferase family 2 protein [Patescibacteria group bacterium]